MRTSHRVDLRSARIDRPARPGIRQISLGRKRRPDLMAVRKNERHPFLAIDRVERRKSDRARRRKPQRVPDRRGHSGSMAWHSCRAGCNDPTGFVRHASDVISAHHFQEIRLRMHMELVAGGAGRRHPAAFGAPVDLDDRTPKMLLRKPLRVSGKCSPTVECCPKSKFAKPSVPVVRAHEFEDNRLHAQIVGP